MSASSISLDQIIANSELLAELSREELAAMFERCNRVHGAILARLLISLPVCAPQADADRLVDVEEASRLTGLSRDALYRRHLPFKTKLGANTLRFSVNGISRWVASKRAASNHL